MAAKWILIVDDEDAILTVLRSSLKKLGADYNVVTASDGNQALALLGKRPFDLVVTDYRMAGMDGLELLGRIRALRPEARVVLMTGYGNRVLEAESKRLNAFRYLTKPLELDTFRQVVKEAVADLPTGGSTLLILSEERYRRVNDRLTQLQMEAGARCVLLTDSDGRFIARTSDVEDIPLEQVASLLGGCAASLLEAGRVIDGDEDTINMAYREGTRDCLYAVNVGHRLLLTILIARGPHSSRLGSVWFAARRAAVDLGEVFAQPEYANPDLIFGAGMKQAIDQELRSMLAGQAADGQAVAGKPGLPAARPMGTLPPNAILEPTRLESAAPDLLGFDEAVKAGIVPGHLSVTPLKGEVEGMRDSDDPSG